MRVSDNGDIASFWGLLRQSWQTTLGLVREARTRR